MMKYKRFEIWLADLSPRFGTETGKTRPVLIVQSNLLNKSHPSTIICPITTNIRKGVEILRINIPKKQGGLDKDSSIMIDQVRSIDNKRFLKKLGDLPNGLREKVEENLKIVLDLL
jgi:mRNA interferase MazF